MMCILFHKWGKWVKGNLTIVDTDTGKALYTKGAQSRNCTVCNKEQRREL